MSTYLFEHTWDQERRRLALLEEVFDPATKEHLGRIPLPPGGQCLEIGAGAGSVARWLCERIGPEGRVVATAGSETAGNRPVLAGGSRRGARSLRR